MKYLMVIISALFLAGCGLKDKVVDIQDKMYEVVEIKPPKHFYITLKDVETGEIYKRLYVSKRCSSWKKLEKGSQWAFREFTYEGKKGQYKKVEVDSTFCDKLKELPEKE